MSLVNLRRLSVIAFIAGAVLVALIARWPRMPDAAAADTKQAPIHANAPDSASTPVLVELFTSEGCSSCPPADALLSRLGRTQPVHGANIIILEEHVDYWDRLGWKDPFSSEAATARQNEFGEAFGGRQIYTPQMVVDGHAEFVGSSDSDALRAIRAASQAPKPAIQLSWGMGDTLSIHLEPAADGSQREGQQVFLVVAENMLHSDVRRGENAGRALEHNGVVRQLVPVAKIDSAAAGFSSTVAVHPAREWNRANLGAVVFVQERRSRRILAAAAIPFPKA
jgi:hypothetical protein